MSVIRTAQRSLWSTGMFTRCLSTTPVRLSTMIPSENVADSLLDPELKKVFAKNASDKFTPVQQESISSFLKSEQGIVVRAKTGTGKTLAFGVPILQDLITNKDHDSKYIHSLVLSPTRDLAIQTSEALGNFVNGSKKLAQVGSAFGVVGGDSFNKQVFKIARNRQSPSIISATPGRLIDLLERERSVAERFSKLKYLIIDEADEMVNRDFLIAIEQIMDILKTVNVNKTEPKYKTMMFSATMTDSVFKMGSKVLGEGFEYIDCNHGASEANTMIKQSLQVTDSIHQSHAAAIRFILDHMEDPNFKSIVFFANTVNVDMFGRLLKKSLRGHGRLDVSILHGKMSQGARNRSQNNFRKAKRGVLVASNVAARGMDFPNVSHVLQIGVNHDITSYTHRVGRTGRAGKEGVSMLFLTEAELPFSEVLKKHNNVFEEITRFESTEEFDEVFKDTLELEDVEAMVQSNLMSYSSLPNECNEHLDMSSLAADCGKLYQRLHPENELMFLRDSTVKILRVPVDELRENFKMRASATNSATKRMQFRSQRNQRGGFNRKNNFDRNGGSPHNRGSNSRGSGYSSRGGYSRDRPSRSYDRSSSKSRGSRFDFQ